MADGNFKSKQSRIIIEKVERLIQGGDVKTNSEIGQLLGLSANTIARYTQLLAQLGKIHITRYGKSWGGGRAAEPAQYAFGAAPDGFVPANKQRPVGRPPKARSTANVLSYNGIPTIRQIKATNTGELKRGEIETFLFGSAK